MKFDSVITPRDGLQRNMNCGAQRLPFPYLNLSKHFFLKLRKVISFLMSRNVPL